MSGAEKRHELTGVRARCADQAVAAKGRKERECLD